MGVGVRAWVWDLMTGKEGKERKGPDAGPSLYHRGEGGEGGGGGGGIGQTNTLIVAQCDQLHEQQQREGACPSYTEVDTCTDIGELLYQKCRCCLINRSIEL